MSHKTATNRKKTAAKIENCFIIKHTVLFTLNNSDPIVNMQVQRTHQPSSFYKGANKILMKQNTTQYTGVFQPVLVATLLGSPVATCFTNNLGSQRETWSNYNREVN